MCLAQSQALVRRFITPCIVEKRLCAGVVVGEQARGTERAAETGRYLLRAMKTGVSAIIDPTGREIASAPVMKNGMLVSNVSARAELTPYVRFGDWPIPLRAAALLWLLIPRLIARGKGAVSSRPRD